MELVPVVSYSGRVVVVTGGTRGIGAAIAAAFAGVGAKVVVCARTEPDFTPFRFVQADLREPDQAAAVVDAAVSGYGRLDVLVNNAGGSPSADAATVSPRFVQKVVALNLLAPFYTSQQANAVMQQQDGGGVILNIGSVAAHQPEPGTAAYAAAKAGLLTLTRALALEWAPRVRVNHLTVGPVGSSYDPAVSRVIPMGRTVQPADVAAACLYLASPRAAYLTGADLPVHGGGELPARYVVAHPPR